MLVLLIKKLQGFITSIFSKVTSIKKQGKNYAMIIVNDDIIQQHIAAHKLRMNHKIVVEFKLTGSITGIFALQRRKNSNKCYYKRGRKTYF